MKGIVTMSNMEEYYTRFWKERLGIHFYPSEFLVRTLLSKNCPELKIDRNYEGRNGLDLGCGDGRNMGLMHNCGMNVYGTEITEDICVNVQERMKKFGIEADIRLGRNNSLPFANNMFDYIIASASVYYVDPGTTFDANCAEFSRVLKSGGYIIFTMVHPDSYILKNAEVLPEGHRRLTNDPLGLRNGYVFKVFEDEEDITQYFESHGYTDICIGNTLDNYYGLQQDLWLLVARKK